MTKFSKHAERRIRQRGATLEDVRQLLENADIDVPVGGNCRALRVRRHTARFLKGGDRLHRYAVIVSDDTGEIVTVLRHRPGPRGRHYRKGVA